MSEDEMFDRESEIYTRCVEKKIRGGCPEKYAKELISRMSQDERDKYIGATRSPYGICVPQDIPTAWEPLPDDDY